MDLGNSVYDYWSIPLSFDDSSAEAIDINDLSLSSHVFYSDSVSIPDSSENSLPFGDALFGDQENSSDSLELGLTFLSPGDYPVRFNGELDLSPISDVSEMCELGESSVDSEKYPRDYGFSTNQADASDSSSDDSSDSRVLLISNTIPCFELNEKKKSRKAKKTWSKSEDEKLLMICKELNVEKNHRCWKQVAKKLNTSRTPKQCREHYNNITSMNKKSTWSSEEDAILILNFEGKMSDEEVSKQLKRNSKQINERKAILLRNRRLWNQEEDCVIRTLMGQGKKPREITNVLKKKGYQRTNQQVKDRMAVLSEFHP